MTDLTTLDPRALLSALFPETPLSKIDAPARSAEVLAAAIAAQAWFLRLLLPRLSGAQRLRLQRAAEGA